MKEINKEKKYYQEIAKRFFFWTGKGPFLSSKDMTLIDFWRDKNIPLNIVLEAIDEAFENLEPKALRKEIKTLYFCNKKVLDAYRRYLERKIGLKGKSVGKKEKFENALKEINLFLNNLPKELEFLRSIYEKGLKLIKMKKEEELEDLDNEVEFLIFYNYKDKFNKINENDDILKRKITKEIRKKYKIPYLSPFYY
ncbi:hypothetical protein NLC82_03860 [Candidatus Aminicenantes bacterium AC-335-A11]|jgi:hypothetical protein|nr:hypothetical protein [SCandidatus Aminicenantes bacterium Aminicenantia_JdfR_composite]MCP2598646.1 hypothetical protein [Candidatus Aminicenantes bacterium AC-335-L06]MCP2618535.1 hypothetical protein [Candidatus Aminicenantes bacterium AC-335-A11]